MERIPIPRLTAAAERPFVRLVDEILAVKDVSLASDTTALEEEVDQLVYDLYGLKAAGRAAVGG